MTKPKSFVYLLFIGSILENGLETNIKGTESPLRLKVTFFRVFFPNFSVTKLKTLFGENETNKRFRKRFYSYLKVKPNVVNH